MAIGKWRIESGSILEKQFAVTLCVLGVCCIFTSIFCQNRQGIVGGTPPVGSCKPFTGKGSTFSDTYKAFLRKYWEAQVMTYEKGYGWIQWTWKTENADEWSYQGGLANGWIPKDPTERKYPNACN